MFHVCLYNSLKVASHSNIFTAPKSFQYNQVMCNQILVEFSFCSIISKLKKLQIAKHFRFPNLNTKCKILINTYRYQIYLYVRIHNLYICIYIHICTTVRKRKTVISFKVTGIPSIHPRVHDSNQSFLKILPYNFIENILRFL